MSLCVINVRWTQNSARYVCLAFLFASLFTASAAWGQGETNKSNGDQSKSAPTDPWQQKLKSPADTLRTFLTSMTAGRKEDGARCLEGVNADNAAQQTENASYLKDVIDRIAFVNYALVPSTPDHFEDFNLRMMLEKMENSDEFSPQDLADAEKIVIRRGDDQLWRFSRDTVDALADLWHSRLDNEVVEGVVSGDKPLFYQFNRWLVAQFPAGMRKKRFLIHDYQWYCLAVVILIGFFCDFIVRRVLTYLTEFYFRRIRAQTDFTIRPDLWKPLGLLTQATIWYWGTRLLLLPERLHVVLRNGLQFFAIFAAVWTVFHMIGVLTDYLKKRAEQTETKFDDLLIPLVSKSLKFISVCLGIVFFADVFEFNWTALIGGLGLGGMALALAAKDTLANFFGSIMVLLDHPFEIGDWIVTDEAEGTVESVGIRSTRIRTFYDSMVTLPNSQLTTAKVDNMGKRRFRRIKAVLHLDYGTHPDQVDAFCEGVRELLRRHPYTRKDYYHVYLNGLGDDALDILLYCFLECPDWSIELREKHRLLLDIVRLAQELKIRISVPTRSVHLFQEGLPPDPDPIPDPLLTGQRSGAKLAGRLLDEHERPGTVEFTGPTPVSPSNRG